MAKVKPRVKVPKKADAGEVITIKSLISHPMESGQRKDDASGELIPRMIINRFECKLDGEIVFSATLYPAVSANPYLAFWVVADKGGELEFFWADDSGDTATAKKKFAVE